LLIPKFSYVSIVRQVLH